MAMNLCKVKTSMNIDDHVYKELKHYCIEHNLDMSAVIERAIDAYIYEGSINLEGGKKWKLSKKKEKTT